MNEIVNINRRLDEIGRSLAEIEERLNCVSDVLNKHLDSDDGFEPLIELYSGLCEKLIKALDSIDGDDNGKR